jgi:hypothetical protein
MPTPRSYSSLIKFAVTFAFTGIQFVANGQNTVSGSMPLDLAIDARSAALGGKVVADLKPDGHASAYNPVSVDSSAVGIIHTSYLNYYAAIQIGAVDAVIKTGEKHTIHVGARFASFGKFSGYDISGSPTGDFSGGDYVLQSGIKWELDSVWSIGITGWGGFRNLALENAGVIGIDAAVTGRWPNRKFAAGILLSSFGRQFAGTGSQPVGAMPVNLQIGFTKGFENAPFQLYLKAQNLEQWELAPEGVYADGIDPLTGEIIQNSTWEFGDQFMRHISAGVEISLGSGLAAQIGYDHRRRIEMVSMGRKGTNGFSMGVNLRIRETDIGLARNTYHFAGSSTHLSIAIALPG